MRKARRFFVLTGCGPWRKVRASSMRYSAQTLSAAWPNRSRCNASGGFSMQVFIYILSDPRTGQIRYVGKTHNPKARRIAHKRERYQNHKCHWVQSIRSVGLEPEFEVVEETSEAEWPEAERWWISYLRFIGCPLTNSDAGGRGAGRLSEETKQKISKAHKGRVFSTETREKMSAWQRGRKLSEEHRKNASLSRIGKKSTPKARANQSASWTPERRAALRIWASQRRHSAETIEFYKSRKHTPETKAKIGAAHKGRKFSPETIQKMKEAANKRWSNV